LTRLASACRIAAMGLVIFGLIAVSMIWVGFDAKKRDWSQKRHGAKTAEGQIIGVVLLWIIFFPIYLIQRRNAPLLVDAASQRSGIAPSAQAPPAPVPVVTGTGFKTCPDCAETVQADARVCKHCRYRFDTAPTPVEGA
jgi:hypothetical protein